MRYQEPAPISRSEALNIFDGDDREQICFTLVRVAFHEPDFLWAQECCLRMCDHRDDEVKGVAATRLGHIGRIHGKIDVEKVKPILERFLKNPRIAGQAQDALDDIKQFVR